MEQTIEKYFFINRSYKIIFKPLPLFWLCIFSKIDQITALLLVFLLQGVEGGVAAAGEGRGSLQGHRVRQDALSWGLRAQPGRSQLRKVLSAYVAYTVY